MEWFILVSGGIVYDCWCHCKVVRSLESGFLWTYHTELVVNISNETKSISGQVDSAISLLSMLTLHGKLYTANVEICMHPFC